MNYRDHLAAWIAQQRAGEWAKWVPPSPLLREVSEVLIGKATPPDTDILRELGIKWEE